MIHRELFSFFVLGVFQKGLTAVVQTQKTVVAAVGEEAHLSCQLLQSKDVLQVTWQKVFPDGEKNLGTYNKYFGQTVNEEFTDKVKFKNASLQSCSIVIREVTEQDEGCYYCLFIIYPDGSLTGTTCLQVYELHEPVLHVQQSDSAGGSVVSCSATGRPAPTVTLNVTQQHLHFSHYNTVSINNNDTVTVTTTAVLSGFHGNSTQVGCAARVLSGPQMEAFVNITDVQLTDGSDEESGPNPRGFRWPLIIVGVLVLLVACGCVTVIMLRKDTQDRKSEILQTTINDTQNPEERSVSEENNQVRKRTPPQKHQETNIIPPPSTTRRLFDDPCCLSLVINSSDRSET